MKQGSTDDPFTEEPRDGSEDADDADPDAAAESDTADDRSETDDVGRSAPDSEDSTPATGPLDPTSSSLGGGSTPAERERADANADPGPSGDEASQRQTLPYIHARDGVKDGRTQRPVFLRDHVEAGIDDLVAEMESELDEDVYKTDVTEAAMAVAQENPELVLAKLEEWGYGWT